jgi:hypothetical protein
MLGDVAMHDPSPRVVSLESNHNISAAGERDDVPSRRVVVFKRRPRRPCRVLLRGLRKDGKVVPMKVYLHGSVLSDGNVVEKKKFNRVPDEPQRYYLLCLA